MANKTPVRVKYNGSDPSGLAEFQNGEFVDPQFLPKNGWTYISNSTPSTPIDGESWYEPSTGYVYLYKTNAWKRITTDDQLSDSAEPNSINAGHF